MKARHLGLISRAPAGLARPASRLARPVRLALARRALLRHARADMRFARPCSVILEPTLRCQLSCSFCFQRGHPQGGEELDLQAWDRLLAIIAPRRLKLIGGEVLLRHDGEELIRLACQRVRSVTVTSNGLGLDHALASRLARLPNLARLSLSLCPGPEGPVGHLARLAPMTRQLRGRLWVMAQLLVEPGVGDQAARALAALPDAGVRWALLMQRMWSTPAELARTRSLLEHEPGWSGDWPLHAAVQETPPEPVSALTEALTRAHAAARKAGVVAIDEVGLTREAQHRFHQGEPGRLAACRYLLTPTLRLDPAGQVIFCEHLRRPLGDPRQVPLEQIWNGQPMLALRRHLLRMGPLPACRRCCKLVHLA